MSSTLVQWRISDPFYSTIEFHLVGIILVQFLPYFSDTAN